LTLNLDRGLFRNSGKINLIIKDFILIVESNVVLRQPVGFSFSKISQTKDRWRNRSIKHNFLKVFEEVFILAASYRGIRLKN